MLRHNFYRMFSCYLSSTLSAVITLACVVATQRLGVQLACFVPGEITLTPMLGESQNRDRKMLSRVPRNADPSDICKLHNRPLVREGTPHQQTHSCLKIIKT
jgi:hypothetical protein